MTGEAVPFKTSSHTFVRDNKVSGIANSFYSGQNVLARRETGYA